MGSRQFEMEYIEYLQARNSELVEKLSQMKEIYENKVCSQDLSKLYFSSGIQEILNLCTTLPEEIDLFFDEMTAAMNRLKNILLKKSEMVQLVDKISQTINGVNNVTADKNVLPPLQTTKRNSTVKVSPMIHGHVISTVPRVYLNRVSNYAAFTQRNVSSQLSPIIETSPVSLNQTMMENTSFSNSLTDSPVKKSIKSEYQATLKQELSKGHSTGNKSDEEQAISPEYLITLNQNKQSDTSDLFGESDIEVQTNKIDVDPLEGPSWLYNNKQLPNSEEEQKEEEQKHGSNHCYVNFKRRKHRFAAVFNFVNLSNQLNSNSKAKEEKPNLDKSNNANNSFPSFTINEDPKNSSGNSFSIPKENSNYERRSKSPTQSPGFIEETPPVEDELKSNASRESLTKMQMKQPVVNLYDCMTDENIGNVFSEASSQKKKSKKSNRNVENKSTSSIEGANTEGRKRRKAAPTNLCEPSLMTKLRRS